MYVVKGTLATAGKRGFVGAHICANVQEATDKLKSIAAKYPNGLTPMGNGTWEGRNGTLIHRYTVTLVRGAN